MTKALGEALAHAGRPAEAAATFLRAVADAELRRRVELHRRAAEQLLIGGHIDPGLDVIRTVLRTVDMRLAPGPRLALASLIARRAQLRWRGLFVAREPEAVAAPELLRLDTCWSVAAGLALVDMIQSADFHARHLMLALDSGVLDRITRAMALEAMIQSGAGGPRRPYVVDCLARAETLASQSADAYGDALCALARGVAALAIGEWRRAHEHCERAVTMLRGQRVAATWERNCAHVFSLGALLYQGELRHVSGLLPPLLAAARYRGDQVLRDRALHADEPRVVGRGPAGGGTAGGDRSDPAMVACRVSPAALQLCVGAHPNRAVPVAVPWRHGTWSRKAGRRIERTQLLRMQLIRVEAWYCARAALSWPPQEPRRADS